MSITQSLGEKTILQEAPLEMNSLSPNSHSSSAVFPRAWIAPFPILIGRPLMQVWWCGLHLLCRTGFRGVFFLRPELWRLRLSRGDTRSRFNTDKERDDDGARI